MKAQFLSTPLYFSRGDIPPLIAAPVALGILIGALVGARVLVRLSNRFLRLLFLAVIVVAAIEMVLHGLDIACLIVVARIYVGVPYPEDILGGPRRHAGRPPRFDPSAERFHNDAPGARLDARVTELDARQHCLTRSPRLSLAQCS